MKIIVYTLFLSSLFFLQPMQAQFVSNPNALVVKKTFIDHYTPAQGRLTKFENITGGWEIGYFRNLGGPVNLGFPVKLGIAKIPEEVKNRTLLGVDAVLQLQSFRRDRLFNPFIFAGIGYTIEKFRFKNSYAQIPGGLGVNYNLGNGAFLTAQAEYRYTLGDAERDNIQYGIGLVFLLGTDFGKRDPIERLNLSESKKDSDGDGLADIHDKCPEEPGRPVLSGCPDSDFDGIADAYDKCPDVMGRADLGGCPDRDRDGIADNEDMCPHEPGPLNGCPDRDSDGIADADDPCPRTPGENGRGCPEGMTSEEEAIIVAAKKSREDALKSSKNNITTSMDTDQTTDIAAVTEYGRGNPDEFAQKGGNTTPSNTNNRVHDRDIDKSDLDILGLALRNVQFEVDKAILKQSSYPYLERLVGVMQKYPEYILDIEGHTDNTGNAAYNKELSKQRAKACVDFLRQRGITGNRLQYDGYGEERPVTSNNSSNGRRINRRVEFKLLEPK